MYSTYTSDTQSHTRSVHTEYVSTGIPLCTHTHGQIVSLSVGQLIIELLYQSFQERDTTCACACGVKSTVYAINQIYLKRFPNILLNFYSVSG